MQRMTPLRYASRAGSTARAARTENHNVHGMSHFRSWWGRANIAALSARARWLRVESVGRVPQRLRPGVGTVLCLRRRAERLTRARATWESRRAERSL
jgi:hypothetical protein